MKAKKTKSLSSGRPPLSKKPAASLSAKATRNLIRSHHQLHSARAKAAERDDTTAIAELDALIEAKGGLDSYQRASILGQSSSRGGDSSRVLMDWLADELSSDADAAGTSEEASRFRVLEVGALSTSNALTRSPKLDVTHIDLNVQAPGITKQDFMQRPLPENDADAFDLISLSLVLNYVPDPVARGEMLKRTTRFLRIATDRRPKRNEPEKVAFPGLFLVLPAPCVENSRYLDEGLLTSVMQRLGYTLLRQKRSAKLVYYLWGYRGQSQGDNTACVAEKKRELRSGKARNNFCVILRDP